MKRSISITRRLILIVLLIEFLATIGLVASVIVHERHVEYKAFDANLRGTANALLSAVQELNDNDVTLNAGSIVFNKEAVYSVIDEHRRSLGSVGKVPAMELPDGTFQQLRIDGRSYRFFSLSGERVVDPDENGGIHHHVRVVYGQPDGHVWHEVFEAVRFVAIAAALLLGFTTLLLVWLIRRLLAPIRELSAEAEKIDASHWQFEPPPSANNIEELQPLASAIQKMMARLRRSFEQQKRFTSDAAHELKTDLAIVKSSFQLLGMKERTNEEYRKGVSVGLNDLARLEGTVQRMLTLARLEQPNLVGEHTCSLDEALQEAIQLASPAAEVKGVRVKCSDAPHVSVSCELRDAMLLCSNVLMNAIHYTPEQTVIEVECREEGARCLLRVSDAGQGIDASELPHLFEPFYRGDSSRSRISGGTGLGLSICKAVCDRAGGSISIANRVEGGAVVTIELPLVAPSV